MGTVNHGDQHVNYSFFDELRQEDWAKKDDKITPRGIYNGGYLTIASPTELTLSPLKVEIGDVSIQVSIGSTTDVSITNATLDSGTLDPATPYIILRYAYAYDPNNFFEVHAVATPLVNDVIVGKVVGSMTSIDYTERSEPITANGMLAVMESQGSGLYVRLNSGTIHTPAGVVTVPSQLVGPFTPPPAPNSRIDLVYIDTSGVPAIAQGVAGVTPVAPAYNGRLVLAEVVIANGVTEILYNNITDVRAHLVSSTAPDDVTLEINGQGQLAVKAGAWPGFGDKTPLDSLGDAFAVNLVYRATSDGYLTVNCSGAGDMYIEAGNTGNPVDQVARIAISNHVYGKDSLTYQITKDEYVRVRFTYVMAITTAWWKPIGTGSLVKQP